MQRHFSCIAVLALTAAFSSLASGCASGGETARVREFLGERPLRVLAAPDRVEVFRIAPQWEKKAGEQTFAGYPLRGKGPEQGREYAKRLAGVLREDGSYLWDSAKGCEFAPGVAFQIWSGKESIIVLLCFACDELGVISDPDKPSEIHIHDDDPARRALLKLAREALADDKGLRELKE